MTRGRRAPDAESGFTLIEVIVAVVIAAMCLTALAGVFSGGTRAAGIAADLSRASTLAQSLLSGAGIEKPLTDGVESGAEGESLTWTVTVIDEPTEDSDNPIRPPYLLKRVTAKVIVGSTASRNSTDAQRSVELTTLRAVPRPPLAQ
ncbi:MAG: type II secretion system protein [Betaproteobacteria bacterium]|nr:MAG: type II secretion system protein [Betaproteobacteria bacterium]TAG49430.1 MAG: type II secretion system protein [Betaproteobacteria bacterium]